VKPSSENREASAPWPLAMGLLAASLTTLLGCVAGCEPETILHRTLVSSVIVCCVAMCVRTVWRFVDEQGEP